MSLKCCEKSYISCRPYYVGWRKYLNCSDAFTRCWHTDIHLLYFCTSDFIIWGLRVKGLSNIWNSCFIHCQYYTSWTAFYSSGHLVLSHFGICMCSNVETGLSWTCLVSDFWISNIPRYFSFALYMIVTIGGTYAPFCIRMASLFFKVKAQGHTLNVVVVVRKGTLWSV